MLRRKWVGPPEPVSGQVSRLAEAVGVSVAVARILAARGHGEPEAAERFLRPTLSQLSSPLAFLGADVAIEKLLECLRERKRILVFGDFDVDGVSGTTLAVRVLKQLGADVDFLLPERLKHGYGLSKKVLPDVLERRPAVVLTVDCAIRSVMEIADLAREGVATIVTDHHEPGDVLPPAVAIVNPKQQGCNYPDKNLAGVGVMWQLLRGVVERLEHEIDLAQHLDLVALGTVADVVPLVGENRVLVAAGLEAIDRREKVGVHALVEVAGIEERVDAWHLAYMLGPRLNAAGRLGDASEAVRLLLSEDTAEATAMARKLDNENLRRQEISEETVRQAMEAIDRGTAGTDPDGIVLASNTWHPGVIGIASSRLVERFYRPSALIAMQGDVGRGSVRSIRGVDVCEVLHECDDLLVQYGGHAMAAGLTIRRESIPEFRRRFAEGVSGRLTEENALPRLKIDAPVDPREVELGLAEDLDRLGPFGFGNGRPVLMMRGVSAGSKPRVVGKNHLKLSVRCEKGDIDCIGFDLGHREFPALADVAGSVSVNVWNGRRTAQFQITDFRESSS